MTLSLYKWGGLAHRVGHRDSPGLEGPQKKGDLKGIFEA